MARQHALVAERLAGTHKPLRAVTFGALGVASMLALDQGKARLAQSHRSKDPEFITREHTGDRAVIVLPGCRSDGHRIVDLLEPGLSKFGPTVYAAYPQNGFSLEAIGRGLTRARERAGKDSVSVVAFSMGGMVLSRLGMDERFRSAFGPIDTLVLDSSPATGEHLKPKMRHLLETARATRHSYAVGRLAPLIMARKEGGDLDEHELGLDDTLIRRHFEARLKAPLDAIASQGDFMLRCANVANGALAGWASDVKYVRSANDSVVDTVASVPAYATMFAQPVQDVIDINRPETSHAGGLEYPSFIAKLLENQVLFAA